MIEQHFREFLKKFHRGGPLLLSLSGGPDSMSLFYLLLRAAVPFSVVHVDHRWRVESTQEATALAQLCAQQQIPFHLHTLTLQGTHNLEERCRQERLTYLRTVYTEEVEGVLLGHQRDDWAETVLKRVLEGASLYKLHGMQPVSMHHGMPIWRPLLSVTKEEILRWMQTCKYPFFQDPTNHDPKYLRSRMRHTLIPYLEQLFGKQIKKNLVQLAERSLELRQWLDAAEGVPEHNTCLDLRTQRPTHPFQWRYIVTQFFDRQAITISEGTRNQIIDHLRRGTVGKTLRVKNHCVTLDRHVLYLHT